MASRAFLAGICRVYFEHQYATQSGFVSDVWEQLVEGPLALFRVVANPPTAYILQLFQHNRPTMFCGVVHYLFGHDVILVLCSSRLFVANLVKEKVLPETLQVGFFVRATLPWCEPVKLSSEGTMSVSSDKRSTNRTLSTL